MLKPIVDFGRQLLSLTKDTQQNKENIKDLQVELRQLRREFEAFANSVERDRAVAAGERENLILRLQLTLERFERRLPPPTSSDTPPELTL